MSYRVCGSGLDESVTDLGSAIKMATVVEKNNTIHRIADIFIECDNCGCTNNQWAKNWTKNPLSAFCPKCTNVYWED